MRSRQHNVAARELNGEVKQNCKGIVVENHPYACICVVLFGKNSMHMYKGIECFTDFVIFFTRNKRHVYY